MSAIQIVCQNCGAKYRLPATFSGKKAKCTGCGAAIDVAAQVAATDGDAAAPAAAKPAAARPAAAKPASARPARARAEGGASSRRASGAGAAAGKGRSRRGAEEGDAEASPRRGGGRRAAGGGRSRRGGEEAEPKKGGMNMLLIVGGAVVVLAVIGFVVFGGGNGDDPATTTDQTAATAPEAGAGDNPAAQASDAGAADADSTAAADAAADEGDAAATTPDPEDPKPAEQPKPSGGETAPVKVSELSSKADVYQPSEDLEPVVWPEEISADAKAEVLGLMDDVKFGGLKGQRAKNRLAEIGWPALFGVVETLRQIDYTDNDQARLGYELNLWLDRSLLKGINASFKEVQAGEEQSLDDMHYNAKTVKLWYNSVLRSFSTKEKFDTAMAKRDK